MMIEGKNYFRDQVVPAKVDGMKKKETKKLMRSPKPISKKPKTLEKKPKRKSKKTKEKPRRSA